MLNLHLFYYILSMYSILAINNAISEHNEMNSNLTENSVVEIPQKGIPTYISPAEKIVGLLLDPLGWTERIILESNSTLDPDVVKKVFKNLRFLFDGIIACIQHIGLHFGELLNRIADKFLFIYPGTKWCGQGDLKDSDGLGLFSQTDTCCRIHDKCNINLIAGESRYGLLNNGLFTRSNCDCDKEFYTCLKSVDTIVSTKVGITYFDILRPQCFAEEYPTTCVQYEREYFGSDKCIEYHLDYWKPKTYQWFDIPDYIPDISHYNDLSRI